MDSLEGLNMSVTVLKSLLSDYALRALQAEEISGRLLPDKLSPEQFASLVRTVSEHMEKRSKERAVHQQALIQATVISLEAAAQGDDATLRATVNKITKQLTMAQSHMNPSPNNPVAQQTNPGTVNTNQ